MTIRIITAERLKIQVEGILKDADGADEPFSFRLDCKRLDADALRAILSPTATPQPLTEVLADVVGGWMGVTDAAGQAVPFGPEALQNLLRIPGLAGLIWTAYLSQVVAKEKN